ncbi:MAG: hypothetical protein J3Q66DRAFT_358968 [Benniella sp.]|nr:MAG: hypothetical protein J3Q66DRAFT_358968 [Benniella sp.]
MRSTWDPTEEKMVEEFVAAKEPVTASRSRELMNRINKYRADKGLADRTSCSILSKVSRVDKPVSEEEACVAVEESSNTADDEIRLLTRKRKLEEAQLEINTKRLNYLEHREQELLRRKEEDTNSLAQLQEIEEMEDALCEAHLSYSTRH